MKPTVKLSKKDIRIIKTNLESRLDKIEMKLEKYSRGEFIEMNKETTPLFLESMDIHILLAKIKKAHKKVKCAKEEPLQVITINKEKDGKD